jgi:hypothetical protein
MVNNFVRPATPAALSLRALRRSTAGGRVLWEHEARPPARFSWLLRIKIITKNQKQRTVRFAHGETKVPNLFQDLTAQALF